MIIRETIISQILNVRCMQHCFQATWHVKGKSGWLTNKSAADFQHSVSPNDASYMYLVTLSPFILYSYTIKVSSGTQTLNVLLWNVIPNIFPKSKTSLHPLASLLASPWRQWDIFILLAGFNSSKCISTLFVCLAEGPCANTLHRVEGMSEMWIIQPLPH